MADHLGHAGFQALAAGINLEFGVLGGLVGAGDAGEVLDGTGPGFGVEALGVALFTHAEVRGAVDFDEVAGFHQGPCLVAVGLERRHKRREHHDARIEEQLAHFANAADVFFPVGIGEAQVFAEAVADVVAVQHVAGQTPLKQGPIDGVGQGAFARTR